VPFSRNPGAEAAHWVLGVLFRLNSFHAHNKPVVFVFRDAAESPPQILLMNKQALLYPVVPLDRNEE